MHREIEVPLPCGSSNPVCECLEARVVCARYLAVLRTAAQASAGAMATAYMQEKAQHGDSPYNAPRPESQESSIIEDRRVVVVALFGKPGAKV